MPDIAAQIKQYFWFHSIELADGVITPGIKSRDIHLKEAAASSIDGHLQDWDGSGTEATSLSCGFGLNVLTASRLYETLKS